MNNLKLAYRNLFRKKQNNLIKILSLGFGLAVGLVLLSKVSFERNYDDFYPDADRIYQIWSILSGRTNETGLDQWGQVSGAIALGMKAELPEVEMATRFTPLTDEDAVFSTSDKKRYKGTFIMADSCFFDVLPRPVVTGNAKEILSRPMYAMVSKSIAEKMGGDVMGKQIQLETYPGRELIIGGIYRDVPENSHQRYDVIVSLNSLPSFFSLDGRENWLGNDRYRAYVKLHPGTDPTKLALAVRSMQKKHQDIESVEAKNGWTLTYAFQPLKSIHSGSPEVKRMTLLLTIIAFALILTAILNYVLIVITALVGRSREIAVYKCYGAENRNVGSLIMTETLLHFVLSLLLAGLLVFSFRGTIENMLSASLVSLFSLRSSLYLAVIAILIFLFTAFAPAYILSRIPVASIFRGTGQIRARWKLILLSVQFAAAAFLFSLLVIVSKQYNLMTNDNPGYSYKNVLHADATGVPQSTVQTAIDRLRQLPQVASVATASTLPFEGISGNNVVIPGEERELFNIADMYWADEHYVPLMEILIIEGKSFDVDSSPNEVIVSRSFKEKMKAIAGWNDVVGKDIIITWHGLSRIVGVYPDIRLGSISDQDMRPSVLFFRGTPNSKLIVKLKRMTGENIEQVYDILQETMSEKEVTLSPYSDSMIKMYSGERRFRDAIFIGGLITVLITLIGLIGYINSEMLRRRAEIAIRKINGANLSEILRLFMKNILVIALLACAVGEVAAALVASKWMENFTEKIGLSPFLFIGCGVIVVLFIELIVGMNCLKAANQNPVDSLKKE
ncbi:Acidobacterial duplicated orphan permease [Proteiniphilum saccharofermentans]|uniref:Acidobacterial duplicated orphan permease n=1 Tax=Proteiniphilum saccharofermentans TaxID=1642647 RepID=A0A1R3TBW7_9BACT|nr:FtsX-like permease family protein [Proteiniphilum saccharofermentans]SCD22107.1 Acidobacterial duplicated orphan permease [Proteiniphilum saccharofermentans]